MQPQHGTGCSVPADGLISCFSLDMTDAVSNSVLNNSEVCFVMLEDCICLKARVHQQKRVILLVNVES